MVIIYLPYQKMAAFLKYLCIFLLCYLIVPFLSKQDWASIATYSQAGAQFGITTLWTALITFPLMAAVQEMCARIGIITAKGSNEYHP